MSNIVKERYNYLMYNEPFTLYTIELVTHEDDQLCVTIQIIIIL